MTRKAWRLAVAAAAMATLCTACGSSTTSKTSTSSGSSSHGPLKVALILDGTENDNSYNQVGYEGLEAAQLHFGSAMQSTVEQNVAEGPPSAQLVEGLIGQGYTLFFIDGTGWETYLQPVAKAHPNIRIEEFESAVTSSNYGAYNIDYSQASYVVGMMLAAASKTGDLGMVTSFPFPGILTIINGMELGAQAVNPRAKMHVLFVSSFDDPAKESLAAQALITDGADALADVQDDPTTCQVAQKDNVPCTDQNLIKSASYGPTTYLASYFYNFTPIYEQIIADTLAKKAIPTSIFEGWNQGAESVGSYGPAYDKLVPASDRTKIAAKVAALSAGTFHLYEGPIVDQQGKTKVPAGQLLDANQILSINWVVKGVIGNISS
jgi:basic membrane lipoprotein Med (substrate-binding protein (PBP1-ABC) superfamily)